jgi:lipoprotein-anchoring transpeptidase ErfK/SrfK
MPNFNRRAVLAALAGATLAARSARAQEVEAEEIYGPVKDEPYPVKGIDVNRVNPRFLRTLVDDPTGQPPGTIVVDPKGHFLYLVIDDGQAIRYGVGVGREGFAWSGTAEIGAKREWPDWYPPKEMFARQPEIVSAMSKLQSGLGMHGGPSNPLGARAMYLYQNGKDTLFRIHGTVEPYSIGSSVSSGCIRMMNQDVLDLYSRVGVGTKVVVLGDAQPNHR